MHQPHCQHCGEAFTPCPRVKNQKYCSKPECQKARKRLWHKQKLLNDEAYRINQEAAKRRWRQNHSDYCRKYRASHPGYVLRNREKQRIRNKKRRDAHSLQKLTRQPIAKMDAINGLSAKISGKFRLIPVSEQGVAKMDALIVQISAISPQLTERG